MSKVPYTVNVDDYVCTELERLRMMTKTLDFSQMSAIIERIQFHVSSMESALYTYRDEKDRIKGWLSDEKMLPVDFMVKMRKMMEEKK